MSPGQARTSFRGSSLGVGVLTLTLDTRPLTLIEQIFSNTAEPDDACTHREAFLEEITWATAKNVKNLDIRALRPTAYRSQYRRLTYPDVIEHIISNIAEPGDACKYMV